MNNTSAFLHSTRDELKSSYQAWESRYPESLQWRKNKAKESSWWDKAAALCLDYDVPAPLMLYICFAYTNSSYHDAEVPFSANTLRSESLMIRAIANFKAAMNDAFLKLEPVYLLKFKKPLQQPRGVIDTARLLADLTCEYFKTSLEIKAYEFKKVSKGQTLPDPIWDTMAYKLCDRNPFILLKVAKGAKMRSVAAVNAFFTIDRLPWHYRIWEGVAAEKSLMDPEAAAGHDVREFYANRSIQPVWPIMCLDPNPIEIIDEGIPSLMLNLLQFPLCHKTDLFLSTKLYAARSGAPNPYQE